MVNPSTPGSRPLGTVLQEVSSSLKDVVQSEIRLAKAEAKETTGKVAKDGLSAGIFGAIAFLGVFPLISFFVIGLGRLLGDNYWLSSLVVAAVMVLVGGGLAYLAYKKLRSSDLKFERTRDGLNRQIDTTQRKVHEISEAAKRRPA